MDSHHLPIGFVCDLVEVSATLLTEILVWTHGFVHDADTATMLPDFARVALNEHAPDVIAAESI